jgi:hypothetical protein
VDHGHSIGPDACEAACPIEAIQPGSGQRSLNRSPIRHTGRDNQRSRHLPRRRVGGNGADLHEERSRNRGDRVHPGGNGSANTLDVVIVGAELVGCDPQQSDGAVFLVCWGRTNLALPVLTTACDYPIHGSMGSGVMNRRRDNGTVRCGLPILWQLKVHVDSDRSPSLEMILNA